VQSQIPIFARNTVSAPRHLLAEPRKAGVDIRTADDGPQRLDQQGNPALTMAELAELMTAIGHEIRDAEEGTSHYISRSG
jgi:hypothetical protein